VLLVWECTYLVSVLQHVCEREEEKGEKKGEGKEGNTSSAHPDRRVAVRDVRAHASNAHDVVQGQLRDQLVHLVCAKSNVVWFVSPWKSNCNQNILPLFRFGAAIKQENTVP